MDFDPDAYLKNKFDPDAYLADKTPAAPPPGVPVNPKNDPTPLAQPLTGMDRFKQNMLAGPRALEAAARIGAGGVGSVLGGAMGGLEWLGDRIPGSKPTGASLPSGAEAGAQFANRLLDKAIGPPAERTQDYLEAVANSKELEALMATNPMEGAALRSTRLGEGAGVRAAAKQEANQAAKTLNAPRDQLIQEARQAGYSVPPSLSNPESKIAKTTEYLAGQKKLELDASAKHIEVTDRLAKQALGLPVDKPLTPQALADYRTQNSKVYDAIRNYGKQVNLKFKGDERLQQVADKIFTNADLISKHEGRPVDPEVAQLKDIVRQSSYSPEYILAKVQELRAAATRNFRQDELAPSGKLDAKQLGSAQRDVANALEDFLERRLANSGDAAIVPAYRVAREKIAKSYDVEAALDEEGHVNASRIARQDDRGRPLNGPLGTISSMAKQYPQLVRDKKAVDAGRNATTGDVVTGVSTLGAAPIARMGMRRALLSQPIQRALGTPAYLEEQPK